ncbi:MAG: c-type cytochrome [Beijerinckiaceae bacterium]|nr:c-type cytochrome [Beijerinckiaceae bacterium]
MTGDEDANFIRTLIGVLGALVVFSVVLMYFSNAIGDDEPTEEEKQEIAERIAPVGQVDVTPATEAVAASATSEQVSSAQPAESGSPARAENAPVSGAGSASPDDKGKAVYDGSCFACHTSGLAGAPKLGDKVAWEPRIAQGMETLVAHAIQGFQGAGGMMPPKGGRDDLADADVKAAVMYMANQSR